MGFAAAAPYVLPGPAGSAPSHRAPEAISLRLRDPRLRKIAAVRLNGMPVETFTGETIELARPMGRLLIEVTSR